MRFVAASGCRLVSVLIMASVMSMAAAATAAAFHHQVCKCNKNAY
jgi:hypothetical protein